MRRLLQESVSASQALWEQSPGGFSRLGTDGVSKERSWAEGDSEPGTCRVSLKILRRLKKEDQKFKSSLTNLVRPCCEIESKERSGM
jgi:hypothetical protein